MYSKTILSRKNTPNCEIIVTQIYLHLYLYSLPHRSSILPWLQHSCGTSDHTTNITNLPTFLGNSWDSYLFQLAYFFHLQYILYTLPTLHCCCYQSFWFQNSTFQNVKNDSAMLMRMMTKQVMMFISVRVIFLCVFRSFSELISE